MGIRHMPLRDDIVVADPEERRPHEIGGDEAQVGNREQLREEVAASSGQSAGATAQGGAQEESPPMSEFEKKIDAFEKKHKKKKFF
jgi:hypothetical protein